MEHSEKILLVSADTITDHSILRSLKNQKEWRLNPIDQLETLNGALKELTIMDYQLILVDCPSLQSSPLEIIIQLRAINNRTPVILLNDPGMEKTAINCIKSGASYYLIKDGTWLNELPLIMDFVLYEAEQKEFVKQKLLQLEEINTDLKNQAVFDDSTQFYSTKHFQSLLSQELKRASRYGHNLACLILDLKNVEDLHMSKLETNRLYEELALLLRSVVRSCDIWARLSSNRFAALLPHTDNKQAKEALRRIESEITGSHLNLFDQNVPLKIQWGLANFDKTKIKKEEDFLEMAMASLPLPCHSHPT